MPHVNIRLMAVLLILPKVKSLFHNLQIVGGLLWRNGGRGWLGFLWMMSLSSRPGRPQGRSAVYQVILEPWAIEGGEIRLGGEAGRDGRRSTAKRIKGEGTDMRADHACSL
jgi:hypothetical protein